MDLPRHQLAYVLWNEAQRVRRRDARLFEVEEPRAFDVPVTLLVFLKELQLNECSTDGCSGSAPQVQMSPAAPGNLTVEMAVNGLVRVWLLLHYS